MNLFNFSMFFQYITHCKSEKNKKYYLIRARDILFGKTSVDFIIPSNIIVVFYTFKDYRHY